MRVPSAHTQAAAGNQRREKSRRKVGVWRGWPGMGGREVEHNARFSVVEVFARFSFVCPSSYAGGANVVNRAAREKRLSLHAVPRKKV